ncbi:hypothetical protein ACLB2K_013839 [Fragaria x ananassa]
MGNVSSDSNYSEYSDPANGWRGRGSTLNLELVAAWNQWCPTTSTSYDNVVPSSGTEWQRLPAELVMLILDKLLESIDYVHFAAVCNEWYRLAKDKNTRDTDRWYHRPRPPMLLLPPPSTRTLETRRTLCSILQGTTYNNIQIKVPLPKTNECAIISTYCRGSGHGWLAKVRVYDYYVENSDPEWSIELVNPFRQVTSVSVHAIPPIKLRLDDSDRSNVPKVILSSDPALNPDKFWVLAFLTGGSQLAFHKRGQDGWTLVPIGGLWFSDAIFYKGSFCAISDQYNSLHGSLLVFDVENVRCRILRIGGFEILCSNRTYLVESTKGYLLCVKRIVKCISGDYGLKKVSTESFKVYKLELDNLSSSTTVTSVEVINMEDETLFVGDTPSVSVVASDFCGCQPNSIYFTDDSMNIPVILDSLHIKEPQGIEYDMGVFSLADQSIKSFSGRHFRPSVWITTPPPYDPSPGSNTLKLTRASHEDKKKGKLKHWLSCFSTVE